MGGRDADNDGRDLDKMERVQWRGTNDGGKRHKPPIIFQIVWSLFPLVIDDVTQEVFYHLSSKGVTQWEKPGGFDEAAYATTSTHQQRKASKSKWQPVATPKGKNLYFWNSYDKR